MIKERPLVWKPGVSRTINTERVLKVDKDFVGLCKKPAQLLSRDEWAAEAIIDTGCWVVIL